MQPVRLALLSVACPLKVQTSRLTESVKLVITGPLLVVPEVPLSPPDPVEPPPVEVVPVPVVPEPVDPEPVVPVPVEPEPVVPVPVVPPEVPLVPP